MTNLTRQSSRRRIFLTGEPGTGKTTVLRKTAELLETRGLKVGGMASKEIRGIGSRTGFSVENLATHEHGCLAEVGSRVGPHVGKYTVNLHDLETVGVAAIQTAIQAADVVLIDELGPMELHSQRFVESVVDALNSQKHVLGTIHKHANHPLVMKVRSNLDSVILEVTSKNRDELPDKILAAIVPSR